VRFGILFCVFSEMTVTANTKSDPFGPLKRNRLSRFELSVCFSSRTSKIMSTFYLKITK
jgi:hypothetical protein